MLQLASVFSSHMVLQREKTIAVFGTAAAGTAITVSLPERNVQRKTTTQPDGTWRVSLPPQSAGTGLTLQATDGETAFTYEDVAIGEVWLAGGQSNMEYMLKNAIGGQEELARCAESNVRCYNVIRNAVMDDAFFAAERQNHWQLPSAETAGEWSAVAYFAAKELSEKLGVTVGILGCNWGGTSASAWMPAADLTAHTAIQCYWTDYLTACEGKTDAEMAADFAAYLVYHAAWEQRMAACYQEKPDIKWSEVIERCGENRYPGPMGVTNPLRPAGLYQTMLSRVVPYTLRGFWYYQGESDDHRPETYALLLSVLIARWRKDWEDSTLPFLLVQLPMFCYEAQENCTNWAEIRAAQMQVFQTVRNTGLAVALDCGDHDDIHPKEKRAVAHRLALQALYHVYRTATEAESMPSICQNGYADGNTFVLHFSQMVELRGEAKPDFVLAGADGIYYPAEAICDGCAVRLTADAVTAPLSARYAWRNWGAVCLYTAGNGIPVPPFCVKG